MRRCARCAPFGCDPLRYAEGVSFEACACCMLEPLNISVRMRHLVAGSRRYLQCQPGRCKEPSVPRTMYRMRGSKGCTTVDAASGKRYGVGSWTMWRWCMDHVASDARNLAMLRVRSDRLCHKLDSGWFPHNACHLRSETMS